MFNSEGISGQNNNTPITAGPSVGLTLISIIKDDKSSIKINFKGTNPNNTGVFTHTVFAIDKEHSSYKEENTEYTMASNLHIANRFVDEDIARKALSGTTWDNYADNMVKLLTPFAGKNIPLKGKITIRTNGDKTYNQFPRFPNFLSSEKFPTQFSTNPKYDIYSKTSISDKPDNMVENNDNMPF